MYSSDDIIGFTDLSAKEVRTILHQHDMRFIRCEVTGNFLCCDSGETIASLGPEGYAGKPLMAWLGY